MPTSTAGPTILLPKMYPAGSSKLPKVDQLPALFYYMKEAMMIPGEKSAVIDLTHHLLHLLDYHKPNGIVLRWEHIPFFFFFF
jgi:hypothetical protein